MARSSYLKQRKRVAARQTWGCCFATMVRADGGRDYAPADDGDTVRGILDDVRAR